MLRTPTRRQLVTAAAYRGDGRRPTQAELGRRFGVSQSAISRRLNGFVAALAAEERERYLGLLNRGRRRPLRLVPLQLSLAAHA